MKTSIIALLATIALALPAMAQTTLVGPGENNGDLEDGVAAPFAGAAGTISTAQDHTTGSGSSIEIDLTANNGFGKWKALTDGSGVVASITDDTLNINHSLWVYIPDTTEFPDPAEVPNGAVLGMDIEYDDGTGFVVNKKIPGAYAFLNLQTAERNKWIEVGVKNVNIPDGTIAIRTRPYNIATVDEVGDPLVATDGGTDGSGGEGPAVPQDWIDSGYNGVLYLDDFSITTTIPPDPALIVCEEVANGDFEGSTLAPWNPRFSSGSIDTVHNHTPGGSQSLALDLSIDNGTGQGRWKNVGLSLTAPVEEGDRIGGSAWFFIPSSTDLGTDPVAKFNFEIRSDKDAAGTGNHWPHPSVDLTSLPRDEWVEFTFEKVVEAGDTGTITSINTTGWNLETVAGDQTALGYGGMVYIDDVKFVNLGKPASVVLVDADTNNGDIEDETSDPWVVSGAGTSSTDFAQSGTKSVKVDLQVANSNGKWKNLRSNSISTPTGVYGLDRVDVSAWVYIPSGTTFGTEPVAKLNLPLFDGGTWIDSGAVLNLATAERDTWIHIEKTGIDITGTTTIAINNWNLETVDTVNGVAGVDATPTDWAAEGYAGHFYIDDFHAKVYKGAPVPPILITSTSYDTVADEFTINYDTTLPDGVDVFYSDDLVTWEPDGFEEATGSGLTLVRSSAVAGRYFRLVEVGGTP